MYVFQVSKLLYLAGFEHQQYVRTLSFEKWCRMHLSVSQMDVWSSSYDLFCYNYMFSLFLSLGSMLERLVSKNAVECTSQHLKWMSGARVMICLVSSGQADKRTSGQADKRTSRQADKRTSGQADKRTSRQADMQTSRQADMQTCRQADKQTC